MPMSPMNQLRFGAHAKSFAPAIDSNNLNTIRNRHRQETRS